MAFRVLNPALLVAWSLLASAPAGAQGPAAASSDTLSTLRQAVAAHPDSVELLLALGRYLARSADEVESNFRHRVEAAGYLDRAFRLRPNDPRMTLEYGLLLRKQRRHVDAMRVLQRSARTAARQDSSLSPSERADLHEQMARLYELWWEDWANTGKDLEPLKEKDRAAMMRHLAAALEADSGRVTAAIRMLRWLADWERWSEYIPIAERVVHHSPGDPQAWLFLGFGYHENGRTREADSAFGRALRLADTDLRITLISIAPILLERDLKRFAELTLEEQHRQVWQFWGSRDPLFLSEENERLAEHYSRVAYAELVFSSPAAGIAGRNSTPGRMWIWFGRPDRIGVTIPRESFGASLRTGRSIQWRYGEHRFELRRKLSYRLVGIDGLTLAAIERLRADTLEWFRSAHPRIVAEIPFQATRFRGGDGHSELVVHSLLPLDSLGSADSIEAGFFAFGMNPWRRVASGRRVVARAAAIPRTQFVATLAPGDYFISVEARGRDSAATGRDSIVIAPADSGLAVSDLLLADRLEAPAGLVRRRDELTINGSATLTFPAQTPFGIVWEIYGLNLDSTGVARYRVQLEVRDTRRGAIVRAWRAVTGQGNAPQTLLEWDGDRGLTAGDASLEYTMLALENARAGAYQLVVTITDRVTGATAKSEREFKIVR